MSRLIVVSNRVQPPAGEGAANQGGLAVALSSALRECGGLWFGWSGSSCAEFSGAISLQTSHGVTTATVDLAERDVEDYYNGYSNRTLWPLFHDRLDIAEFRRDFEEGYERVNRQFADTLTPLVKPGDCVWVHDYHLIPLGRELRARGIGNRIGFFLHTPWLSTRMLLSLPHHRELAEALYAYDVIGFQTQEWLDAFLHYSEQHLGVVADATGAVVYKGRTVRTLACPIGIDAPAFRTMAWGGTARAAHERMMRSADGRAMILGVDRLDYSKGLQERFLGYERFLAEHPDAQEEVFLLQIAPPSREDVQSYQEIRAQLDALSGRINGEYASVEWVPIRYVNKGYPRDKLAGMYRAARIGLVTPLRDGMNLVAKEYVAAQDPEDPGVLVLSTFAGAARQMRDALLVNPHSAEDVADAIARALAMPRAERVRRWSALMAVIEREDVNWWRHRFMSVLDPAMARAAEDNPA